MRLFAKRIRIVVFCWSLLSVTAGIAGYIFTLNNLSAPRPISKTNMPQLFCIVAFADTSNPIVLQHTVSPDPKRRSCTVSRKHNQHPFYIDKARIERTQMGIWSSRGDATCPTIRILADNLAAKKQTIRFDFGSYLRCSSVYTVNANTATPIAYGEMTKEDRFTALTTGLGYMLAFYLTGRIALATFLRKTRSQATVSQVQP